MNKTLKIILIVIVALAVIFIVIPFIFGFFSSFDPSGAANQGKCVAACREEFSQTDPQYNVCTSECIGPVDIQE